MTNELGSIIMPTVAKVARTDAGLASELRLSVMRLRRRLAAERHPDNELASGSMAVLGWLYRTGGELTVTELADAERVKPPSMSRNRARAWSRAATSRGGRATTTGARCGSR